MKLSFSVSTDKINSGYKNDDGVDLYTRDFVIFIQDEDRSENNKLIENWQIIFTLDDEEQQVKDNSLIAEKTIIQLNKYIECYRLIILRNEIAASQLKNKETENLIALKRDKSRMIEIQRKLNEYDAEYRTILNSMAAARVGIDDISYEWIVDNMINAELMWQDALLYGTKE